MKILKISIEGIGGIANFSTQLHPEFNIFCGSNGIGKTTILDAIAAAFSARSGPYLKRGANAKEGTGSVLLETSGKEVELKYRLTRFIFEGGEGTGGNRELAEDLLYVPTQRDITYQKLNAIQSDPQHDEVLNRAHHHSALNQQEVKAWFVNRFLWSHVGKSLSDLQKENNRFARSVFALIDKGFSFAEVLGATNEVLVKTPTGTIPFEFLSSGFRSSIALIFGLIKEIEFRKKGREIPLQEFAGVVLIDELDMHLHPAWQQRIVGILRGCFPKAQFITTTHSPFIVQSATPAEVIALRRMPDGGIAKILTEAKRGFSGWTIEEIAKDVLDVGVLRTDVVENAFAAFQRALETDNEPAARSAFANLDELLHPSSLTRQLIKEQLADFLAEKGST
jgi:energy-coupling factor transporter ATP-binding protein EcfA2